MHELVMPSAASGSLAASSWAFADDTSSGTIAAIDAQAVTLNNGDVCYLPADFRTPVMNVGEAVTITWMIEDDKRVVTGLKLQL